MHKFTVNRQTWLRGEGSGNSCLRRGSDGKQCCLGFLGLSLGYTVKDITNITSPSALIDGCGTDLEDLFPSTGDDPIYDDCLSINDDELISDMTRETRLYEKLGTLGTNITFE